MTTVVVNPFWIWVPFVVYVLIFLVTLRFGKSYFYLFYGFLIRNCILILLCVYCLWVLTLSQLHLFT